MLFISSFATIDAIGVIEGNKYNVTLSVPTEEGGQVLNGSLWVDNNKTQKPVLDRCVVFDAELLPARKHAVGCLQNFSSFYYPLDDEGKIADLDVTEAPSARVFGAGCVLKRDHLNIDMSFGLYSATEGAHTRTVSMVASEHLASRMKVVEKGKHVHFAGILRDELMFSLDNYQLITTTTNAPAAPAKRKAFWEKKARKGNLPRNTRESTNSL